MHAAPQMGTGGTPGGIHANIGQAPGPGSSGGGPINVIVGAATGRASEVVLGGAPGPNPSPGGVNITLAGAPVGSIAALPAGVSVGFAASAEPVSVSVAAGGGGHRRSLRAPLPAGPTTVVGPAGPASVPLAASAAPAAAAGLPTPLPAAAVTSLAGRVPVMASVGKGWRLVDTLARLAASSNPGQHPVQPSTPAASAQAVAQISAGYSGMAAGWRHMSSVIGHLPQLNLRPSCPASAAMAGSQEATPNASRSPSVMAEGAPEGPAGASHPGFPPELPAASGAPLRAGAKAERLLNEGNVHVDAPYTTVTVGSPRAGAASTSVEVHVPGRKLAAARALAQADAAAPSYSVVPVETPQGGPAGGNVEVTPGRRLAAPRGLTQVGGTPASVETALPAAAPGPNPYPCFGEAADCMVPGRRLAANRTLAQVSAAAPFAMVAVEAPRAGFAATYINAPGINFAMGPSQSGAVTNVVVQVGRKLAAGNARALRQAGAAAQGTAVVVPPSQTGAAEAVVTAPGAAVAVEPSRGAAGTDVEVQVGRKLS